MKPIHILRFVVILVLFIHGSSSQASTGEKDSLLAVIRNQQGRELVQSLNELSWIFKNINMDSALYFADIALMESEALDDIEALASSYNSLANVYEALGELDSALHYHNQSLTLKLESGDSIAIANSFNNLGIVYDELGQHEKALQHYYQALNYYESSSSEPFKIAMVLGNAGIVLKKQRQFQNALEYYLRALKIYEQENSDFGIAVTTGNIGSLYIQLNQYDEAIRYSEVSITGYQALGYARYVPYSMHNMAIAYDSLHEYKKAESLYYECLELHNEHQNVYEMASAYINLADNQFRQQAYLSSLNQAQKAIAYAEMAGSPEFMIRATKILAMSNAKAGQFNLAYQQLLSYTMGQDSLFEKDKTRAIIELETKYETARREKQIELQEATIREQELVIERDRILLAGFGIVGILFIGLGFIFAKKEKYKREKLAEQLKAQQERDQMTAVISSQENERKRFAADIHDGFGQLISVLKINLSSLDKVGEGTTAQSTRQELYESSAKIIDDMYAELRNVCFNIMPQTLVKRGLPAAIKEFADRLNSTGKIITEVLIYDMDERIEDIQEISIYRITQEVVNNILKYADANKITIQLTKDQNEITLMIEDDGLGFNTELMKSSKGNGWKNLNTRTNFIKGQFEYDSRPGVQGTTFILNVPIGNYTYAPDTVVHG